MKWPMKPLSELCFLAVDCVNKTAPIVEYQTPYKMIRTTNVKRGFIDINEVRSVLYSKGLQRFYVRFKD
jgi:type I restriction enzyme, S subunit